MSEQENKIKKGIEVFNELYCANDLINKKAVAFDKIAKLFYNANFGSATKAEIELLMFSIYMEAMIDKFEDASTKVLNYNACSDYLIGQQLGIPQERVRSLKVKKQARYPKPFKWTKSLEAIKDNIVYDESKKKIIIPVRDPNLYNEIRNFIESKGGYIEIQRGNNCIQIRPEYFFILLYKATDSESDKEEIRKTFAKKLREHNEEVDIDSIQTDEELSKKALEYGEHFFDFALSVAEGISNPLVGIIKGIQVIAKVSKTKRGG